MLRILVLLPLMMALQPGKTSKLFLDLTAPSVAKMDKARKLWCGSGGGVFISGSPNRPPELGLRLSIKDVSKRFVTAGQSLTADVRLTNTGDKSIALPWDPNQAIVYGKDCQGIGPPGPGHPVTLEGSLLLKLVRGKVEGEVVGGHSLYSRMDQPDSYRVLQPGQSAVIRVGGRFNPPSTYNTGHRKRRPGTFRLIAVFTLTDSAKLNPYRAVVSENSVEVAEASR